MGLRRYIFTSDQEFSVDLAEFRYRVLIRRDHYTFSWRASCVHYVYDGDRDPGLRSRG